MSDRDGLVAGLMRLADTIDSYCDHDDPDCLDSIHACARSVREFAAGVHPRSRWAIAPWGPTSAPRAGVRPPGAWLPEALDDAIHALAGGDLAGGLLAVRAARERLAALREDTDERP